MAAEERRRVREEGGRPDDWDRPSTEELALEAADEEAADEAADELEVSRFQALLQDRRKIASGVLVVLLLVVAIYVLFPKIVGADEAVSNLDEGEVVLDPGRDRLQRARLRCLRRAVSRDSRRHARRRGPPAPRPARLLPDHHGRPGRHAHLLGRRSRRDRAHVLGAAQGRHAAPARRLPDGGVPGPDLLRLPRRARDLRRAAEDGRAARACAARGDRRARRHLGRGPPPVRADRADPAGLRAAHPALRRRVPAHALPPAHRQGPGDARNRRAHRDRVPPAPAARPAGGRRGGGVLGGEHRRAVGEPSRRSEGTCRSPCSCRASSSAWPRT